MDDIEPTILYSIAITAVILGFIAIVFAILSISVDDGYIPPAPSQCEDSCTSLGTIPESCTLDTTGVCTNYIIADIQTDDNVNLGLFILSPVSTPYTEACYGLCNGDVSKDQNGNYICKNDDKGKNNDNSIYVPCEGLTTTECKYNICLNTYKPKPGCSGYSAPVGCKDGVLYYLKSTSKGSSTTCACNF